MLCHLSRHRIGDCLDWVRILVANHSRERKGTWSGHIMDKIAKEGKKYLEKSGETSKKGSSGKSSSKTSGKKGGGSGADKAKRAAKEFLK